MLVVEDNIINQKVMKRQLEARGCLVYTASNGLEAVQFIEKSSLRKGADLMMAKEILICFMVRLISFFSIWVLLEDCKW